MSEREIQSELHPDELAARQRTILLRIVRTVFIVIFATVTTLAILDIGGDRAASVSLFGIALSTGWSLTLAMAVILGGVALLIDLFTPQKKISTLVSVFLGLLAAMLATLALGSVVDLLATLYDIQAASLIATIKVLLAIGLGYLCITTVLQTQDDFRLVVPYIEFAKQIRGTRPILLDSSVLIDGRILGIAKSGFVQAPLVIPRFVILELQLLADNADQNTRAKGRRGLDLIARLQREPSLDVSVDETKVPGRAVDQMLVELAKQMNAFVCTSDTGLARVAAIEGAGVLSVHELAAAVKADVQAGEQFALLIVKRGEQQGQGVGYLPDGTMVVVDEAQGLLDQHVEVRVTGSLQTAAGRMLFAKLVGEYDAPGPVEDQLAGGGSADDEPGEDVPAATGTDEQPGAPKPRNPFPPKKPNPRMGGRRNPRR